MGIREDSVGMIANHTSNQLSECCADVQRSRIESFPTEPPPPQTYMIAITTQIKYAFVTGDNLISFVCPFKHDTTPNGGDIMWASKEVPAMDLAIANALQTATAGSDVVQSGRPIFDDFFQHLWPYIGNNTANVVFQMVKRLWLIRIDQ
ncbi:hypothetical protein TNCV_1487101 [Trichonephila clavipes]|nr:hypothetical protein TNCV_1487101 [Trichonephila clavipes]